MIAEGRESGGLGGLRKKVIFDAQPLKTMRENSVVPPGLESFFPLFPALKRWAKFIRPSGAGFSWHFVPPGSRKTSSHAHT